MNFGEALKLLKSGKSVTRSGWNAKHLIYLRKFDEEDGRARNLQPCIVMLTAQSTLQPGWLASQADILANDWEQVGH